MKLPSSVVFHIWIDSYPEFQGCLYRQRLSVYTKSVGFGVSTIGVGGTAQSLLS